MAARPPAYSILSTPPDMSLTPRQQGLKERFDAELSTSAFDAPWARLLKHSPDMFAASVRLAAVPKRRGSLSPKVQALISLAVASAATHLHVPNMHRYTRQALLAGASQAEIVETLCLTATLGVHACNIGVPLLVEVLREQGKELPRGMEGMSKEQWDMKDEFERKRGYWHAFWEDFLRLSPEFFGAYTEFSSVPWTQGVLEPKVGFVFLLLYYFPIPCLSSLFYICSFYHFLPFGYASLLPRYTHMSNPQPQVKELIYCAFDASATHLYQPGLKLHMQNVLKYGGTADEIMEVLELATLLSISTLDVGLPVLEEEARKFEENQTAR